MHIFECFIIDQPMCKEFGFILLKPLRCAKIFKYVYTYIHIFMSEPLFLDLSILNFAVSIICFVLGGKNENSDDKF